MSKDKDYYEQGHNGYYMSKHVGIDGRIDNIRDWLIAKVPAGSTVLDIGCGDMTMSKVVPEMNWVGLDIDDKKDPRIVKQDITQTPYMQLKTGSYDAILCSEVLEHLFQPLDVMKEAYRLLKPKGYFIVTVPNFDSLENLLGHHREMLFDPAKFWTIEHIRLYNHETMTKLLTHCGFKVHEQVGQSTCFSPMLVNCVRVLSEYLRDKHGAQLTQGQVDQLFGRILPFNCPGLGFLAQKL